MFPNDFVPAGKKIVSLEHNQNKMRAYPRISPAESYLRCIIIFHAQINNWFQKKFFLHYITWLIISIDFGVMKNKIFLSNVFTCLVSFFLVLNFTMICEKKACIKSSNEALSSEAFRYDRSLGTGFGDRISVYLSVAAAAATVNRSVYVWWHQCNKDIHHHSELCLDEVNMRIAWPSNLHVLSRNDFYRLTVNLSDITYNTPGVLMSHLAFDSVYTTAWKTMRLPSKFPELHKDSFERSYKEVCKQFELKGTEHFEIPSVAYSVLHIRGGDKQTDRLEFNTKLVLSQMPNGRKIVVITDDNAYAKHIISEYRKETQNNNSLDFSELSDVPHNSTKHEALFRDFHALMRADEIIQHSPASWSAFSNVASMIQTTPLLNTWHPLTRTNDKYMGIMSGIHEEERCPVEFFSSNRPDQVAVFIENMKRKKHHQET